MKRQERITCLNCGMRLSYQDKACPKCDNNLATQTDGSTITVDIAHHGERVRDALDKLQQAVVDASAGVTQNLRVIVGSGRIREAAMHALQDEIFRGGVIAADFEQNNRGSILVQLK